MKKLVLLMLSAFALLVAALPAEANSKEVVGPTISPLTGHPTTFQAGSPFHVGNCWNLRSTVDGIGKFSIALDVDGVPLREDFTQHTVTSGDPDVLNRCWVWNFRAGLGVGMHTFVQHWFAPCSATGGPCTKPNEEIEVATYRLSVTFA